MSWQIGAAMNAIVMVAYLGIAWAIIRPLAESGQLWRNRLGLATATIFFTCAVHHGHHFVHMVTPAFGIDVATGAELRSAWRWDIALWDVLTAAAGVYYWTLRRTYGPLMRGAILFEDLRERQQRALEINDDIVQGLTVALMAIELDDRAKTEEALQKALTNARHLVTDLLAGNDHTRGPGSGDLRRRQAAEVI
jgi:hypothetical protein